jgi:DNA-binding NtrC family response regulator
MNKPRILIVDDETGPRESLRRILEDFYEIETAEDGEGALKRVAAQPFDLMLLDIMMPGKDGLEVLRETRALRPFLPVIVITALDQAKTAVEAMRQGAFHYEVKPFDKDKIRSLVKMAIENRVLKREVTWLQTQAEQIYSFENLVGISEPMQRVFALIRRIADTDSTVLITGESGTGKELVARALHYNSSRRDKPFVPFDCGAVAKELIESELFGHEKGAFTGALTQRLGLFEAAEGGTLFLDEIGEMETGLQSRLLRVLQEKQIRRVGSNKPITVDVRLIAATSRDLTREIKAGRFREDLFYRINVVPIHLPPLRERAEEDVPLLVAHFSKLICKNLDRVEPQFDPEAIEALIAYSWPGNIRELRNCIERVLVLNGAKAFIRAEDLPPHIKGRAATASLPLSPDTMDAASALAGGGHTLEEIVSEVERTAITNALKQSDGVLTRAAELLGTTRRILKYKMDKLGIASPRQQEETSVATSSTPML